MPSIFAWKVMHFASFLNRAHYCTFPIFASFFWSAVMFSKLKFETRKIYVKVWEQEGDEATLIMSSFSVCFLMLKQMLSLDASLSLHFRKHSFPASFPLCCKVTVSFVYVFCSIYCGHCVDLPNCVWFKMSFCKLLGRWFYFRKTLSTIIAVIIIAILIMDINWIKVTSLMLALLWKILQVWWVLILFMPNFHCISYHKRNTWGSYPLHFLGFVTLFLFYVA